MDSISTTSATAAVTNRTIPLFDLHPEPSDFRDEVLTGLSKPQKQLPSMYFYDERGSKLFDQICELEEYYPTRTESAILRDAGPEIAELVGERAALIELGSGSSAKTHVLLDAFKDVHSYIPIDISRSHLMDAAARVARRFASLRVRPVCADFMAELRLPPMHERPRKKYVLFPGSTIGNFHSQQRQDLLARVARLCQPEGGGLLIGIDLKKDRQRLERAYNDAKGVTADFNLNLLRRINCELDGSFRLSEFEHQAFYNAAQGRIEMHLVSRQAQSVSIAGQQVRFREGESICTEYSYKFSVEEFCRLAAPSGFHLQKQWTDREGLFAVLLLGVSH
jgi:dimethylhistidine N-methyltransferase